MSTIITPLALLAITALAAWTCGSLLLRAAGTLALIGGLLLAATGMPAGLIVLAAGCIAWLAGQWLHALRHHTYPSPLARRMYTQTALRRLDPTRHWAIPIRPQPRDDHHRPRPCQARRRNPHA